MGRCKSKIFSSNTRLQDHPKTSAPMDSNTRTGSGKGKFECTLNITGMNIAGEWNGREVQFSPNQQDEQASDSNPRVDEEHALQDDMGSNSTEIALERLNRLSAEIDYHSDDSGDSGDSDNYTPFHQNAEAGPSNAPNSASSSHFPSGAVLTFNNEHIPDKDVAKVERFIRVLHSGSDEWAILQYNGVLQPPFSDGILTRGIFTLHSDELRRKNIWTVLDVVKKVSIGKKWGIVWKPSHPVNAVRSINSLDDAIRFAGQSNRVYPHLKRPNSKKEWDEAWEEAKRKTAHLVRRYWICVSGISILEKEALLMICSVCVTHGIVREIATPI
jgi:hypothetical protein